MKKAHWLALGFLLGLLAAALFILAFRRAPLQPLTLVDLPTPLPLETSANVSPTSHSSTLELQKIDLNQITYEQLIELPGIGEVKAKAILNWRETHGPFTSVEDLLDVPGIGDTLLLQLLPYLSVGF
jgi:competence ComEA-like helix-hairpin-helix protein